VAWQGDNPGVPITAATIGDAAQDATYKVMASKGNSIDVTDAANPTDPVITATHTNGAELTGSYIINLNGTIADTLAVP
jgi:hypothetical protein